MNFWLIIKSIPLARGSGVCFRLFLASCFACHTLMLCIIISLSIACNTMVNCTWYSVSVVPSVCHALSRAMTKHLVHGSELDSLESHSHFLSSFCLENGIASLDEVGGLGWLGTVTTTRTMQAWRPTLLVHIGRDVKKYLMSRVAAIITAIWFPISLFLL